MTTGEGDGRVEEVHLLRKVIRVRRVAVEEGSSQGGVRRGRGVSSVTQKFAAGDMEYVYRVSGSIAGISELSSS